LNQACVGAFAHEATQFQVLHVAGEREYDEIAQTLTGPDVNPAYHAFAFLDDFPLALAAADAVVARAGGSVAEILARGIPALLVPYPYASADHQTRNAEAIAAQGAALVVADADLSPEVLTREVATLLDPELNARMRSAALSLAKPDAATRIADLVVELAAARAPRP
jgi:UDP-N-acetylglucosamine--N-acetylmuramyl-(pentapeptide) pyrophosphoryl-undecaprenol N-acetylglucosamine transferase